MDARTETETIKFLTELNINTLKAISSYWEYRFSSKNMESEIQICYLATPSAIKNVSDIPMFSTLEQQNTPQYWLGFLYDSYNKIRFTLSTIKEEKLKLVDANEYANVFFQDNTPASTYYAFPATLINSDFILIFSNDLDETNEIINDIRATCAHLTPLFLLATTSTSMANLEDITAIFNFNRIGPHDTDKVVAFWQKIRSTINNCLMLMNNDELNLEDITKPIPSKDKRANSHCLWPHPASTNNVRSDKKPQQRKTKSPTIEPGEEGDTFNKMKL